MKLTLKLGQVAFDLDQDLAFLEAFGGVHLQQEDGYTPDITNNRCVPLFHLKGGN